MAKKYKIQITLALVFFLVINTSHLWEAELGFFAMPASLVLFILFIVLFLILLKHIFLSIREKLSDRKRLGVIVVTGVVLGLTYLFPMGIISDEKWNGKDLLVAGREGVANCTVTLKLKENNRFAETSICFGMTRTTGDYRVSNDTIYFENVQPARGEDSYYNYAVIRSPEYAQDTTKSDLVMYLDASDTSGSWLLIVKNDLHLLKKKEGRGSRYSSIQ